MATEEMVKWMKPRAFGRAFGDGAIAAANPASINQVDRDIGRYLW